MNTFADRLRHARTSRQLSQAQLAQAAKLSQSAISNYETKHRATSRGIMQLAAALEVSPKWLAEGIGPMESPPTGALQEASAPGRDIHPAQWPFKRIRPSVFYGLSSEQQFLIEDMILAMVQRNLRSP